MTASTNNIDWDGSPNWNLPYAISSQDKPRRSYNDLMKLLDMIHYASCKNKGQVAPTGSEADGVCYIVAANPSGEFAHYSKELAGKYKGRWHFVKPRQGMVVYVKDLGEFHYWGGSGWTKLPAPT